MTMKAKEVNEAYELLRRRDSLIFLSSLKDWRDVYVGGNQPIGHMFSDIHVSIKDMTTRELESVETRLKELGVAFAGPKP